MLNDVQLKLLEEIADLHGVPEGAYNIRANGEMAQRNTTANVDIVSKEDVSGIDIFIRPGTKNESIHIPVVLSKSGIKETVYNDFHVGDDCDVLIVAGCGIDNCGTQDSEHDGVHRFFVGKNAKVRYVEKHYGSGEGEGKRILNPVTEVFFRVNAGILVVKGKERYLKSNEACLLKPVAGLRCRHPLSGYFHAWRITAYGKKQN